MGALTNKPMAFNSRNWEYNTQLTNDITEFLSPKIRVDQFNGKIYRILPTVEWISNRIRFLYLGLRNQRITTPMTSYKISFEIDLKSRSLLVEKQVLLSTNYENVFTLLKTRLLLKKKKKLNVIHGAIFDADTSSLISFENYNTDVINYSELNANFKAEKLVNIGTEKPIILYGVNPRMESPLLNLKLTELCNSIDIYSFGNFSFSYPTKILSNNNGFYLYSKKGFIKNSLLIFGISSIKMADDFLFEEKITLVPLYLFNNALKTIKFNQSFINVNKSKEDLNLFLCAQNLLECDSGFNIVVSTHFENNYDNKKVSITIPVNGYLETSFSYYDKSINLVKLNGLKPSFGINDLLFAFKLFNNSNINVVKIGNLIDKPIFKKKINNVLINNSISNYLIRDALGRANPLFKIA